MKGHVAHMDVSAVGGPHLTTAETRASYEPRSMVDAERLTFISCCLGGPSITGRFSVSVLRKAVNATFCAKPVSATFLAARSARLWLPREIKHCTSRGVLASDPRTASVTAYHAAVNHCFSSLL